MHTSPWQQPGQVAGPHCVGPTHFPPLQLSSSRQASQGAPPLPQAAGDEPERQTPPMQHPEQVSGEQPVSFVQDPLRQISSCAQLPHAPPALPHEEGEVPG